MHAPDLLPWCAATQDWFFKLGNTKPEGGFGVGKPPFWERPAYLLWTGAADDQEAEEARLAEVVTGFRVHFGGDEIRSRESSGKRKQGDDQLIEKLRRLGALMMCTRARVFQDAPSN